MTESEYTAKFKTNETQTSNAEGPTAVPRVVSIGKRLAAKFLSRPGLDTRELLAANFWLKVEKSGSNRCWKWLGYTSNKGYGQTWWPLNGRRTEQTHRISWELAHGKVPAGMFVCHRCDNPPCVNPSHLFLGTNQDNIQDMHNKGRARHTKYATGSRHGRAKLTEVQVMEARRLHDTCGLSSAELGRMFGVSQSGMWLVVNRKTWVKRR